MSVWGNFAGIDGTAATTAINSASVDEVASTFVSAVMAANNKYIQIRNYANSTHYMRLTGEGLKLTDNSLDAMLQVSINSNLQISFKNPENNLFIGAIPSAIYTTVPSSESAAFYQISYDADKGYAFANGSSDKPYMHDSSNGNVVKWDNSANASWWTVEEAEPIIEYTVKDNASQTTIYTGKVRSTAGTVITDLPADLKRDYTNYAYPVSSLTVASGYNRFVANAIYNLKFTPSSSAENATWYFMNIRPADDSGRALRWPAYDSSFSYPSQGNNNATISDAAAWAFIGNTYQGFKVLNKKSGTYLSTGGTMTAEGATWTYTESSVTYEGNDYTGFLLNSGTNYIHDYANNFSTWSGSGASTDIGSFLNVENVEDYIADKIDSWTSGSKWGDYESTSLAAAKAVPTISNYNAITYVAPLSNQYFHINSESIDDLSMSYALVSSEDKAKALTKNTSDVNQIWKIEVTGHQNVKLYNVNAEKYLGNIPNGDSNTAPLTDTGSAYLITWTDDNFVLGSGYGCVRIETGTYAGNLNAWNTNADWSAEEVTTLPIALHQIGDYSYSTLCLPFDVEISGATAYILKVNGSSASAVAVSQVPAGTGVLLRAVGDVDAATATIISDASADTEGNKLTGTYKDITSDRAAGEYILGVSGGNIGFYQRVSGRKIGANKAYLRLDADVSDGGSVKGISLTFDETGINEAINSESAGKSIFDLSGRRVNNPTRGLYIMNGKKVIVK